MKRKAKISRKTKETSINVDLNIDGKGKYNIETGIGFLRLHDADISDKKMKVITDSVFSPTMSTIFAG